MGNRVKIIGAGIAGLSAGCYLQMNGYETEIYELHNIPGGLCTGWERMGYTFDGCVHWLVGSSPENNFYPLWNELINMKKQKFVDHEIYNRIWDKNGNKYIDFYTDVDKLESELLEKAPEDESLIISFTRA
ncbi:MAG: NAD(P)/FAD-dependent oxidoreductase, partial [Candidatus Aminicenantes bacterium]|nr:NAD(P)/FAD-dependent oxidoreductase [Candidatus Aminicenantes bacterium]